MNTCILIGQIIVKPELKYVQDNQLAVADMMIEFDHTNNRDDGNPKPKISVVGWGKLAAEMADVYKKDDYVIIDGRLEMNTIERDGGYKEKRALLVATRIHLTTKPVVSTYTPPAEGSTSAKKGGYAESVKSAKKQTQTQTQQQYDDEVDAIPF